MTNSSTDRWLGVTLLFLLAGLTQPGAAQTGGTLGGEGAGIEELEAPRAGQKLLENTRTQLFRRAQDPRLKDAVNQLYRPNAKLGNGSSMDAFRIEGSHVKKLFERRTQLTNLLKNRGKGGRPGRAGAPLNASDRALSRELLIDIQNALSGLPRTP